MRQVIYPAANSLKIFSKDNQSYQSGESSVIAKVDFCNYTKYGSCIVEFDKDSTQLKIYKSHHIVRSNPNYNDYGSEDHNYGHEQRSEDYGDRYENNRSICYDIDYGSENDEESDEYEKYY